ncbi:MAG: hypothetical protein H0V17_22560 [Deltaproteobacteria bacterium]|nr:hypothetical protein [Deltaproteobacteria bacterium]
MKLALAVLAGCGIEDRPPPTRFVGASDASRTLVFVVRDPSQTNAYACDGTRSPALFEWFAAPSADALSIDSDTGTATLDIDFVASTATLDTESFTLVPVDPGFGLYRGSKTVDDTTYEAGIVLLDEDVQNGVIGITDAASPELTVVVSPRIQRNQISVTLLNDVRIPLENPLNAYAR